MQKLPGWLVWMGAIVGWFSAIGVLTTFAQAPPLPTSYEVRFYLTDTSPDVIASSALPSSVYACNVDPATPLPGGRVTAYWEDPSTAGRQCRYTDPGNGAFVQPPPNQTVRVALGACVVLATGGIGCSSSSNRVPYTRTALPGIPTGFGVGAPPPTIAQGVVDEKDKVGPVEYVAGMTDLGVRLLFGIQGRIPVEKGQRFALAVWPK